MNERMIKSDVCKRARDLECKEKSETGTPHPFLSYLLTEDKNSRDFKTSGLFAMH